MTRKQKTPRGALALFAWATVGGDGCTYDYGQFSASQGVAGSASTPGGNSSTQVAEGGATDVDSAQAGATFAGTATRGGTSSLAASDVNAGKPSSAGASAVPDSSTSQGGDGFSSIAGNASATGTQRDTTGGGSTLGGSSSTQRAEGGAAGTGTAGSSITTGGSNGMGAGQGGQSPDAGTGGTSTGGQSGAGGFSAEDGLVAHFAFDESTGTVAENLKDATKNATYVGSCTHPAGHIGNAVGIRNLNADTSGPSDWIELPAGLLSDLAATTVSLWVRDLSKSRTGGRLFDFSLGAAEAIYFAPDDTDASGSLAGGHLGGTHHGTSFVDLWIATPALTDKAWHQIAFTWDAASVQLYVDGNPAGSKTNPGVLPSDLGFTSPDWLGRTLDDEFIALYAEIDDLRVYDKVLSATEIARLYQQ